MTFYKENCTLIEGVRNCNGDCGRCGFDKKIAKDRRTRLRIFGLRAIGSVRKLVIPKTMED